MKQTPIVAFRLINEGCKGGIVKQKPRPIGISLGPEYPEWHTMPCSALLRERQPGIVPENDQEYVEMARPARR